MTKTEAIQEFRTQVVPLVIARYGRDDKPAMREAWNNFTDALCKDGLITLHQYETWIGPFTRRATSSRDSEARRTKPSAYWKLEKVPRSDPRMSPAGYRSGRLTGLPLWEYTSPDREVREVRAEDKAHAISLIQHWHPEAVFAKPY